MNWLRSPQNAAAQTPASIPQTAAAATPLSSRVYVFEDLAVRHLKTTDARAIVGGKTVDGCAFSVHESALQPNTEPHPPHRHTGEEMFMVLDGTLRVTINGVSRLVTKGGVAFIGTGDEHASSIPEPRRQSISSLSLANRSERGAMTASRREFCIAIWAAAALPHLGAAQMGTLPSKVYDLDQLPAQRIKTVLSRAMFAGKLYEGCEISLHESDLDPNSAPHPPHSHRHEEMVFVLEGVLEFTIHGEATRAGAGSVLFAGSNEEHGIRNPTAEHAKYFVLALGPGKD